MVSEIQKKLLGIFFAALGLSSVHAADLEIIRMPCEQSTNPLMFEAYHLSVPKKEGLKCMFASKRGNSVVSWRTDTFEAVIGEDNITNYLFKTAEQAIRIYSLAYSGNTGRTSEERKIIAIMQDNFEEHKSVHGTVSGNGMKVFYSHRTDHKPVGDIRPMNGNIFIFKDKKGDFLNVSCQCSLQEMFNDIILPAISAGQSK